MKEKYNYIDFKLHVFEIKLRNVSIFCVISVHGGWEHISVSIRDKKGRKQLRRCPTWEEMCKVKEKFWNDDEEVIQIHPKKENYINDHPYCLHLWKPIDKELVLPDKTLVNG